MNYQPQERPPFVMFELRAVEDREASVKAGHLICKDVAFALITPMGSKDQVEAVASEWLDMLKKEVAGGRFSQQWLANFEAAFKAWEDGNDLPANGVAIRNWPPATPAEVKMLQDLKILTVEDLANSNEAALSAIGIGGRQLRERARAWLQIAAAGAPAEELSALRQQVAEAQAQNENLLAQMQTMRAELDKVSQGAAPQPTTKAPTQKL